MTYSPLALVLLFIGSFILGTLVMDTLWFIRYRGLQKRHKVLVETCAELLQTLEAYNIVTDRTVQLKQEEQ